MDRDTSKAARVRYIELLITLGPERRLRAAIALSRATRALAEAGVQLRMPEATDRQRRRALVALLYGEPAALRLCGPGDDGG